jgi:septum formation protein
MTDLHPRRFILASSSVSRRELLLRLRVPFETIVPAIDETPYEDETPAATAVRLAEAKARTVAERVAGDTPNAVIIGADQLGCCDGEPIGKPGSHALALAQLQRMRGRQIEFHSALCVYDTRRDFVQVDDTITYAHFLDLPDHQLDAYLHAEGPYQAAGGVKAEGLGITLFSALKSDDPTALLGLPLITLTRMLSAIDFDLFGQWMK